MMRLTSFIRFLGLMLLPIITAVVGTQRQALAQSTSQAAIVVSTGDGTSENRCVAFESEDIAGLDLLKGSGFETEFEVKGFGSAVCSITGIGCAADDCFCECGGVGECVYWSYWHLEENAQRPEEDDQLSEQGRKTRILWRRHRIKNVSERQELGKL